MRRIFAIAPALLAATLAIPANGHAQTPQSIYGCANSKGLVATVSITGATCNKNETLVVWSLAGTQGPQGLAGATGAAGPQGQPGSSAGGVPALADRIDALSRATFALAAEPVTLFLEHTASVLTPHSIIPMSIEYDFTGNVRACSGSVDGQQLIISASTDGRDTGIIVMLNHLSNASRTDSPSFVMTPGMVSAWCQTHSTYVTN